MSRRWWAARAPKSKRTSRSTRWSTRGRWAATRCRRAARSRARSTAPSGSPERSARSRTSSRARAARPAHSPASECDARATDALCAGGTVKPGEVAAAGAFTVVEVGCLGACDRPPVMMVNDEWHERARLEDAGALVDAIRANGGAALTGCYLDIEKKLTAGADPALHARAGSSASGKGSADKGPASAKASADEGRTS